MKKLLLIGVAALLLTTGAARLTAASAVSVMSATIRIFAITETGDLSPASCEKSNFVTSGEYRGSGT
jgi:hypothetical protein